MAESKVGVEVIEEFRPVRHTVQVLVDGKVIGEAVTLEPPEFVRLQDELVEELRVPGKLLKDEKNG